MELSRNLMEGVALVGSDGGLGLPVADEDHVREAFVEFVDSLPCGIAAGHPPVKCQSRQIRGQIIMWGAVDGSAQVNEEGQMNSQLVGSWVIARSRFPRVERHGKLGRPEDEAAPDFDP